MLGLLKPFAAVVLAAAAVNPCLAREGKDLVAPGVGRFFTASSQSDTSGFEEVRAGGVTTLNITQLNRVLWESSFERGIIRSGEATLVSTVNPISNAGLHRVVNGGPRRVSHGGMLVEFSSPFIDSGISGGLARRPGIGACLLAALAITALAIFRRRTGYQPIVPPSRLHLEAPVAADGAK